MLQGDLPSPINLPEGCVFNTRCFRVQDRCRVEAPLLVEFSPGHKVACHYPVTESLGTDLILGPDSGAVDLEAPMVQPPSEVNADVESAGSSRPEGIDYASDPNFGKGDW